MQQAFDLETILQTSVGPRWRNFTPDQQQELQAEFLRFTVASYVSNFSSFSGERFDIDPETRAVGTEQVVATHIVPASGDPARIDYVMRQGAAGWRAVDVLLDGSISRVAVQRSDFRSIVESGGPAALVSSLRKKVTDLSGGASIRDPDAVPVDLSGRIGHADHPCRIGAGRDRLVGGPPPQPP